jgi:transposase, IS30 family
MVERGKLVNENMNGLIRQYVPKKCDIKIIDETAVEFIMDRLNNCPRKCLDFMSPLEMFR